MSTNLDPSDVQTVLDVLLEAEFLPRLWRTLGRRLGVNDVDLDTIDADFKSDGVERCLEAVIDNWKRNGENTWGKLADAVSKCEGSGGGSNVARKVREKVGLQQAETPPHDLPHQERGDSGEQLDLREGRALALPPPHSSPLSPLELSSEGFLSDGAVERIAKQLTETFNYMVGETQKALEDSNADPRKVVNVIHRHDAHFSYVPGGFFRSLREAKDVTDLFFELDEYWDPFNYFLLERLLRPATRDLFASHLMHVYDTLRECMDKYKKEMEYFRKHTDVTVYCSCVLKGRRSSEVPSTYKELVVKKDFKTLEDVEIFRQELAAQYKLVDFLVFLKKIEKGSVILTFWIPKCATVSGLELDLSESGGGNNGGSSVDPIIIRDGVQVEWSPQSDEPPTPREPLKEEPPTPREPLKEEPPTPREPLKEESQGPTQQESGDAKAVVVKKRSVAGSVITTVSKFVVPKYLLNPILLMTAVSSGDKDEVKMLLSKGADPNASPPMIEFTPLMEASRQGNVEIAGLLLDKGADPNRTNNEGWTALMAATNNGRYGTVDILLQKEQTRTCKTIGWSALMAAVYKRHDEVALRIIQAGATPHLQDKNHTNAILLAIATNEQDRVVEALLERVEDPSQLDLQDSYGETVLIFACKNRNLELVKRLLSMKANPNLCNNHGETPVLIATKWGDTEIVQELLDNYADPNMGNTHPLMVAINLGRKEIAKLLVDRGANIYKEHEGGVLAFEMAELRNFTDLARRLNPQQFTSRTPRDVLRLTIKSMATVQKHLSLEDCFEVESEVMDIVHRWRQFGGALRIRQAKLEEIKAGSGSVPRECLTKTVQEFLNKNYEWQEHGQPSWRQVVIAVGHKAGGSDTELALQIANDHPMKAPSKKKSGSASVHDFSLLMEASRTGDVETAKMLLDHGADPNLANAGGWSALMAAVYKRHDEVALRIIQAGATPHLQDKNKTNAVLLAIGRRNEEKVVNALLDSNPDVDLQDSYGETALIFACKMSNLSLVKRLLAMRANPNISNNENESPAQIASAKREKDILKELLLNDANPNTGVASATPLILAAHMGADEIVDELLSHGADPNQQTKNGVTASQVAETSNHTELAKKLNPQQEVPPSAAPESLLTATLSTLVSICQHLNLPPLFLDPETGKTDDSYGLGFLGNVFKKIIQ
ncbi:Ankyrin-3 [Geodia barretti]|uniref:Ankyrin-3 n=1 Tax=Geodia barretti TaxID=519541 RepID=A0AA35STJ8_GEOBA|nr:Ankyrin-3 [Geodia barretti]